ncbi:hypothetical protein GSY63_17430 [Mucilaginibacter sp. R11]|uniref:Uncharacterized protein n=2 Tax=Mucilaginibacter agri TaxID=2695265 RepID=A0A966DV66_9SPHI|nr:hypothetical protein [Mucilaginibacter agri]
MEEKDLYSEISSIRNLMERSTRFISLSGLSGVMAGVYALIGAGIAYKLIYLKNDTDLLTYSYQTDIIRLFLVAILVLIFSVGTGVWLTVRKARRKGQSVWNQSSQSFLKSGALPLVTGGCFVLLLFMQGRFGIIAPGCLIFYGLALVSAGQHTYGDVKWLGLCEIALGLLATVLPGYGLLFWAFGFGVLHIVYGSAMHFKYDRENNAN